MTPTRGLRALALPLIFALLPALWLAPVKQAVMGARSLDLIGHVWTLWSGLRSPDITRSTFVAWPDGADLLPILGGWLDIFLGVGLGHLLGWEAWQAYNAVWALYLGVAGLGGYALARAFDVRVAPALVAGLLLQLDGYVLWHAGGGRVEQAGLGFVALALAGARLCWTRPGWGMALWTGLAGAAVVYVSWEHALWLAAAMALLLPAFWRTEAAPGAKARWALAGATTALLAGPWAVLFLLRCAEVRGASEEVDKLAWAAKESAALLHWFSLNGARPSLPALASLLLLPWTLPAAHRRLGVAAGVGLALSLILGLGPSPGLWESGDLWEGNWGPWSMFQSLPLLSWFHTPVRLLVTWSLVSVVAAALAVDALALRKGRLAGGLLAIGLLGGAVQHARMADLWPVAGWNWTLRPNLLAIAALPDEGAVLDLPPVRPGPEVIPYQLDQFAHGRPILYHMTLPHLTNEPLQARFGHLGLVRWVIQAGRGDTAPPPKGLRQDLQALREAGVHIVALHVAQLPRPLRDLANAAMEEAAGPPMASIPGRWTAWDLSKLPDAD